MSGYSHTTPMQYISIFPMSPIRCIGCNRSNSRHLATELVDMWSLKNGQEINRTKGTRVDYIQVRRRGFTYNEIFNSSTFILFNIG